MTSYRSSEMSSPRIAAVEVRGDRDRRRHDLRLRHRALGHDVEARVEQQLEAAPAGVDHPGVAEHRQEVGRAGDGGTRRVRGRVRARR